MMAQLLWTQKQDMGPTARDQLAMDYDAARTRVVLFGGQVGEATNDAWEWNGEYRTQTADIGPSLRRGHALAYDSNRERLVMFGGSPSACNPWGTRGNGTAKIGHRSPTAVPRHGPSTRWHMIASGSAFFSLGCHGCRRNDN